MTYSFHSLLMLACMTELFNINLIKFKLNVFSDPKCITPPNLNLVLTLKPGSKLTP